MKGRFLVLGSIFLIAIIAVTLFFFVLKVRTKLTPSNVSLKSIADVSKENLDDLFENVIFFGHQSVGENIISGLQELQKSNPEIHLNIVEGKNFDSVNNGAFFHAKIGRNTRPESKMRAFKSALTSGPENGVDIALMKFCYVDLNRASDPEVVFERYREEIAELQQQFPETVFVHVTVPIESAPRGAKNVVKELVKLLLRKPSVTEDNRVRERYNDLLRSAYSGKDPVFDIAVIESIGPEGNRSYRRSGSERVFMMDDRYTSDGGHLNQRGRVHVAEQLLITLAEAAESHEPGSS